MASKQDLKKKIQIQNMIIIALAIIIFVLVIVSSTAAWYIRTKTDTADIILSNPVNIYITEFKELTDERGKPYFEHDVKTDILDNYNTKVYPGDKIKLRLGMQLGSKEVESSPAYVRVKIKITYENIVNGQLSGIEVPAGDNLLEYKDKPDENEWELVDFNQFARLSDPTLETDYWYVRKVTENGTTKSKITYNLDQIEFLNGYIALSKTEITNAQANCKFHINYVVQAIQVPNVPDPLAYKGYGPWWDFALGDNEDI